jgi:hypothetical protein
MSSLLKTWTHTSLVSRQPASHSAQINADLAAVRLVIEPKMWRRKSPSALMVMFGPEKRATCADNFALQIRNGTEGSNPLLSTNESVLFRYNLEIAVGPGVTRGFCARCEPEKAIALRIVRIPRVFSLSAEETVRFVAGADFVHPIAPPGSLRRGSGAIPSASICADQSRGRSIRLSSIWALRSAG